MRKLKLTLTALTLIFGSALAVNAQEWVKLAPDGGGFEVLLPPPGTPRHSAETKESANGPLTTNLYIFRATNTTFLIGYVDYAPTFNFDVKAEIAANRDNFLKGMKGSKLLAEKEIRLGGNPGLEFTADLENGRFATSRVFVVSRRPYQLIAITVKGADQTDALKFLNSFKLKKT